MSGRLTTDFGSYWRVLGASVQGASHIRQNLINQDSFASNSLGGQSQMPCITALSDGHGSARCFRSDRGSGLAVTVFQEVLNGFMAGSYGGDLSLVKRTAEERLPKLLSRLWQERVLADLERDPVSEAEWEALTEKIGVDKVLSVHQNPLLIYGATLLGVVITADFILYLQLGDGEIVLVESDGQSHSALPQDERLIANETTSLCQLDAWKEFRFRFQVHPEQPPCMLLLSTDGYVNSFRDQAGFLQVGADMLELLKSEGPEYINAQLPQWLSEASEAGSGDDSTVAILWNPLLLETAPLDGSQK